MNQQDIDRIRSQTRIALPDDNEYLFRLGVALYGFASVTSFMAELTCLLDRTRDRTVLEAKVAGSILCAYLEALRLVEVELPQISDPGHRAAELFESLNSERTDFVHAVPVTNQANAQILHRRHDAKGKYFEVSPEFLDSFISRMADVNSHLYQVRALYNAR